MLFSASYVRYTLQYSLAIPCRTKAFSLDGLAALGNIIQNDSDDPEEQRKKIQAQQAGSNLGAILGLAIGAVAAAHEHSQEVLAEESTMEQKM